MFLFYTVTSDKIFHCVVDSVCDVKLMKLNIKLFHVVLWYLIMELSSIERFFFFFFFFFF